jgi:hypothetical protein
MKLSSYYKSKREIVSLAPELAPNLYSKFILRKDYNDGEFHPELINYNNVEYGGLAFSNDIYIPLPIEIEKQIPDTYLYEKMRNQMGPEKYLFAAFETMMRAQHVRLSLDGNTIWSDFEKQLNIHSKTCVLFVHDKDL